MEEQYCSSFYVEKDNRLGITKKDTKAFIGENVL